MSTGLHCYMPISRHGRPRDPGDQWEEVRCSPCITDWQLSSFVNNAQRLWGRRGGGGGQDRSEIDSTGRAYTVGRRWVHAHRLFGFEFCCGRYWFKVKHSWCLLLCLWMHETAVRCLVSVRSRTFCPWPDARKNHTQWESQAPAPTDDLEKKRKTLLWAKHTTSCINSSIQITPCVILSVLWDILG